VAGKTTAVRIMTTLVRLDRGRVEVAGHDVVRQPRQVRRRIGLVGQQPAVDEVSARGRTSSCSPGCTTSTGAPPAGGRGSCWTRSACPAPGTGRCSSSPAACAGGWTSPPAGPRPRGALPRRADDRPRPGGRRDVWDAVRALVAGGTTVLLTTQYLEEAEQLAGDVCVLDAGRVVARGTRRS
jgi:ABC-2 type transport system ATP-binding protein